MSEKLPRVTAADAIRALESAGFFFSRQTGSHKIYKNREGKRATVPSLHNRQFVIARSASDAAIS